VYGPAREKKAAEGIVRAQEKVMKQEKHKTERDEDQNDEREGANRSKPRRWLSYHQRENTAPGLSRLRAHCIRELEIAARPATISSSPHEGPEAPAVSDKGVGNVQAVKILAIVLIVVGLLGLAYEGISYTTREKVLEVGPITATKETKKTIPLPPILGGAALVCGVVLLIAAGRR
jgi:hypothetical protein